MLRYSPISLVLQSSSIAAPSSGVAVVGSEATAIRVYDKRELRERCANFTETEKWKFIDLFEQHKDILLSPDRKPNAVQMKKEIWQNITNQMNSEGTIQPRTAVQLQTLWKNLTCRAKNKLNESRSDSLLGLSTAQSREDSGEIAPMDARVLSILDDLGGASSSVGSGGMDHYGDEPSVSKTASDDSLDWMAGLSAMQTIKSEIIDEYDNDVRGASPADVSQSIETPLPVEKSVPESSCPPKDHDGPSSSDFMFSDPVSLSSKQNVADARNLYMELLNEKRAHLSLKRLKIEAKLKQVELKNRALETAIDANIAKRSKYEEEAKNLHLQNLQMMRTLKCNGFSNSSNVEQIFPPFV